jgi:hypothetical protein
VRDAASVDGSRVELGVPTEDVGAVLVLIISVLDKAVDGDSVADRDGLLETVTT